MENYKKDIQESKEKIEVYNYIIQRLVSFRSECEAEMIRALQFLFIQRQREIDDINWKTEHMKGE